MRNAGIGSRRGVEGESDARLLRRMDVFRQHRKMVVMIDNGIAYTGSMNMVDPRFSKQDAGAGHRRVDLMAADEAPWRQQWGLLFHLR